MIAARSIETPTGWFTVRQDGDAIVAAGWGRGGDDDTALLRRATAQIADYFGGARRLFDLPLRVDGARFQQQVCAAIAAIPFGETRTYGDIARDLGAPAQAVGQACGGNPIPILIPCHRVLGAAGLGGFSGARGIETKVALLRHEGAAGLLI